MFIFRFKVEKSYLLFFFKVYVSNVTTQANKILVTPLPMSFIRVSGLMYPVLDVYRCSNTGIHSLNQWFSNYGMSTTSDYMTTAREKQ